MSTFLHEALAAATLPDHDLIRRAALTGAAQRVEKRWFVFARVTVQFVSGSPPGRR